MNSKSFFEGLLLVHKEKGHSSFHLVSILRRLTHIKKIGHAGTLDPLAEGLMILLIGKNYTRKASSFLQYDKSYQATVFLGKSTDTYDQEGEVLHSSEKIPTLSEIEKTLQSFQGKVLQKPPIFSAKKKNGKKLYEFARKGLTVDIAPCLVEIKVTLLSYSYPFLQVAIDCSKGTYVRSIAHDLGIQLGCYAHLYTLLRDRIGHYHVQDAVRQKALCENSNWYTFLQKL